MANEGHLARLRSGVKDWNAWRKELRDLTPDLNEDGSHFVGVTPSEWRDVRAILRKVPLCLVKDYFTWENAGRPYGQALTMWLYAEHWVLDHIRYCRANA